MPNWESILDFILEAQSDIILSQARKLHRMASWQGSNKIQLCMQSHLVINGSTVYILVSKLRLVP